MSYQEYTSMVSTYHPIKLGTVDLKILSVFAEHGTAFSAYQIFKKFQQEAEIKSSLLTKSGDLESLNSVRFQLFKKYANDRDAASQIMPYYAIALNHYSEAVAPWLKEYTSSPGSYKNTYKRVKRLVELKLIERRRTHLRGAILYRISAYGLIAYFNNLISEDPSSITQNMNNVIIRSLLLHLFEKETLNSFYKLRGFPGTNIRDYLCECCTTTTETCKRFWDKFERYRLDDLMPSDEIIQQYMTYLQGEQVDEYVLNEIKEYEKRLMDRLDNADGAKLQSRELSIAIRNYNSMYFEDKLNQHSNRNYKEDRPPFPLLKIYYDIVCELQYLLETKMHKLCFDIVSGLGDIIKSEHVENLKQLEEILERYFIDDSFAHILKDKKFIQLLNPIKSDFEAGYRQFLHYHGSFAPN
jgi:hypothetical protein